MSAEENRDYVITQMLEALRTISLLADGEDPDNLDFGIGRATPGELATNFSQFEVCSCHKMFPYTFVLQVLTALKIVGCCLATKFLNMNNTMQECMMMSSLRNKK